MDLGLDGRTFVASGATDGLGLAAARVLVAEGANVVVSSRDPDRVDAAAAELGDHAEGVAADLTDPQTPGRLIEAARTRFGGLHGVFISHGGPARGQAEQLDDETLRAALELAAVGPIRLLREVVAALEEGGSAVVLTSTSSVQPIADLATSNVARPAVWGYAKTLADEVAPRGVRVNVLLPGRFATARSTTGEARTAEQRGIAPEQVRAEAEAKIPLRRMGDPDELGRVAAFLLSPAASYVTGAAWAVDGGNVRGL